MGVELLEEPRRVTPVLVSEAPDGLRVTFVDDSVPGTGVEDPDGVLVLDQHKKTFRYKGAHGSQLK